MRSSHSCRSGPGGAGVCPPTAAATLRRQAPAAGASTAPMLDQSSCSLLLVDRVVGVAGGGGGGFMNPRRALYVARDLVAANPRGAYEGARWRVGLGGI